MVEALFEVVVKLIALALRSGASEEDVQAKLDGAVAEALAHNRSRDKQHEEEAALAAKGS